MNERTRATVLVVDDSRLIRFSVRKILQDEFSLIEAIDGEEGWQVLLKHPVDVLITDAKMPKLDGYDLIKRIREHENPRFQNLPIIMITGAEEDHAREDALAIGATDFILKPPDKTELLARVRSQAKSMQAHHALDESLEKAAMDVTTGVAARPYLTTRLEQDIAYAKRHGTDLAVIGLGIDNFQVYLNDHGEKITTAILCAIATMLKKSTRTEDTVARIDQARFAVSLPNANRQQAAVLAERIRTTVKATPFRIGNMTIPITVSMSLSCMLMDHYEQPLAFMQGTEARLDIAMGQGGNRLISEGGLAASPAPLSAAVMSAPITDINKALAMIEKGELERVVENLPGLLQRILPLMELAAREYQWGMGELGENIQKLNS